MDLLQELCETSSIPGFEGSLRAIIRRELQPIVDEVQVDALGNLISVKRNDNAPKLMIAAHMDEIGFIVSHIDDKGWIRIIGLGGHDPHNMIAQRVTICTSEYNLSGILHPVGKPSFLQNDDERLKRLQISDFFIDLGLPATQVKEKVRIGMPVTIQREFQTIGDCISCKALDARVALYVMIRAMQQVSKFSFETYAVATVQEEIGLRGATTSAFSIYPDIGIAVDTTVAADIPGVSEHEYGTQVGAGVAIKILDSLAISHPKLVTFLQGLAHRQAIPWQPEILPRGGTDASAIQRIRCGVSVVTLSIPTRYLHTSVELVSKADIDAAVKLLTAFIEEGNSVDLKLV